MAAVGIDGGNYLESVYLYSVDAATWSVSTAMPAACYNFGMAYLPAHDVGGRGQVMVAGGVLVGTTWTLSTSTAWTQQRGVLLPRCRLRATISALPTSQRKMVVGGVK